MSIEKIARQVSAYNRSRKWKQFQQTYTLTADMKVLDVGFAEKEYSEADNYIERHYPYPEQLTALGIDQPVTFHEKYPKVKTVTYDGRVFPFENNTFDICWSNAVLEHVGDAARQILFLKECSRVARNVFITTPNRFFPVEIHTRIPLLHWLPKDVFEKVLRSTGKAWATGDYMNLLSAGDIKRLLGQAGIGKYTLTRNRMLGWTMDFVIRYHGTVPAPIPE